VADILPPRSELETGGIAHHCLPSTTTNMIDTVFNVENRWRFNGMIPRNGIKWRTPTSGWLIQVDSVD